MAQTYEDGEARSSIRAKLNGNANELDTTSQLAANLNSALAALTTRVGDLESGSPPTTPTSDGALTDQAFFAIDVFNYSYQETGSSGQQFSKDNQTPGFDGTGYAKLNSISAVSGTEAKAYINGFAPNSSDPVVQVDRKVFLRLYGPTSATIVGCSHGGGTAGTATIATGNAWAWVQVSTNHAALDNQYQLHGRSPNVLIDKIILTTLANTVLPTGKDGYRSS